MRFLFVLNRNTPWRVNILQKESFTIWEFKSSSRILSGIVIMLHKTKLMN